MTYVAEFEQWVAAPLEQVFLFFASPANLPRIMPPNAGTELLAVKLVPPPGITPVLSTVTNREPVAGVGTEIVTAFRLVPFLPFRGRWIAQIIEFEWNDHFADVQKKGPFHRFQHRHSFRAETRRGVSGTVVRDKIEYEIGFGILGGLAQKIFVERTFQKMFEFRQKKLEAILQHGR